MEIKYVWNISEIRELAKRYPEVTRTVTEEKLDLVVRRLEKEVVERTPRGVGGNAGLAGSIAGEVAGFGTSVRGVVGTPLEYGEVVELGRRPGKAFPPIEPIRLWVRSKLGISDPQELKSVSFLVARKIAVKGFKGAHMFQRAWDANQGWVQRTLYEIPGEIARRVSAA